MIREIVITFPERKVIGDQSRMKEGQTELSLETNEELVMTRTLGR